MSRRPGHKQVEKEKMLERERQLFINMVEGLHTSIWRYDEALKGTNRLVNVGTQYYSSKPVDPKVEMLQIYNSMLSLQIGLHEVTDEALEDAKQRTEAFKLKGLSQQCNEYLDLAKRMFMKEKVNLNFYPPAVINDSNQFANFVKLSGEGISKKDAEIKQFENENKPAAWTEAQPNELQHIQFTSYFVMPKFWDNFPSNIIESAIKDSTIVRKSNENSNNYWEITVYIHSCNPSAVNKKRDNTNSPITQYFFHLPKGFSYKTERVNNAIVITIGKMVFPEFIIQENMVVYSEEWGFRVSLKE